MTLKLPEIKHPTQRVVLPSCGEEIVIRPYVSKEEKILLMAALSKSQIEYLQACKQIVQNCVVEWCNCYNKVDELPTFDFDYLLLQLRIISVGEIVSVYFKGLVESQCPECQKDLSVNVDLSEVKIDTTTLPDKKVFLNDDYGVILKYFTIKDQEQVLKKQLKNKENEEPVDAVIDSLFLSMAHCIDAIFSKEEVIKIGKDDVEQVKVWLENLPRQSRTKIESALENIPHLRHELELKCKVCGKEQKHIFEGLESFFV